MAFNGTGSTRPVARAGTSKTYPWFGKRGWKIEGSSQVSQLPQGVGPPAQLRNVREACEAYVTSQKSEGWTLVRTRYDDDGWSGGNMERPALKALLADVEAGLIDIVVVYKVDRLSRSLADFARIVDLFDRHGVSSVSVTQAFNTTTSMGRLTLNVLLSFAQFEREVTGERIRDKIAASKARGMWMGGYTPLGYDAHERTLRVNEAEAATVRHIFRRFLELGSIHALQLELEREGITTKVSVSRGGNSRGGRPFTAACCGTCCATGTTWVRSCTRV